MRSLAQYKNIIAAIVVILVFVFLMKKMIEKNAVVMKGLEKQKTELTKGKELILKWQAADKQIQDLFKSFIKDSSTFRSTVEENAQKSGITVNSLVPSKREKDFYSEAIINIKGAANSYAEIVRLIKFIESKNIITDSLRIKNDVQRKRAVDITLKAYILSD